MATNHGHHNRPHAFAPAAPPYITPQVVGLAGTSSMQGTVGIPAVLRPDDGPVVGGRIRGVLKRQLRRRCPGVAGLLLPKAVPHIAHGWRWGSRVRPPL